MKKKHQLAASSAAIMGLACASPTLAQEGSATPQSDQAFRASDIIVTAQRREEFSQDVPIAITAFSNERLQQQNITSGQSLQAVVPSLTVNAAGGATRDTEAFTLRGVGQTFYGAASSVVYLAEVPVVQAFSSPQQGGPGNYVDLENLQVLAGPQGTLFGRNTTGGAILLVPRKPTTDLGGYVQASYGNYDYVGLEGVLNVPIVEDKLLVRIVGNYQDRKGFTQDLVWNKDRDNIHYYSGRISITFKPTETVENYLMAYGSKSKTNGSVYVLQGFDIPTIAAFGGCSLTAPANDPSSCNVFQRQADIQAEIGPRKTRLGMDLFEKLETWGIINKTSVEVSDQLTLNNILSYQRYTKRYNSDGDGTPLQWQDIGAGPYPTFSVSGLSDEFGIAPGGYHNDVSADNGPKDNLKQFTEELQLQGKLLDDHLTFVVGGFFYDQKPIGDQRNRPLFVCSSANTGTANCGAAVQTKAVSSRSKALYAQSTLDLGAFSPSLENVRLTGGYRYTWDRVHGTSNFYAPIPGGAFCINTGSVDADPANCAYSGTLNSKAATWTLGVDYKPVSNLMFFAKASRGYKAAGFNPFSVRPITRTFQPEKVLSYEAGFKSDWRLGDVPLRLNVTGYTTKYTDKQIAFGDFTATAAGAGYFPGIDARIKGVEAEISIRPIPQIEIGGNASYTDGKFTKFRYILPTGCPGGQGADGMYDATCTDFGEAKWIYSVHAGIDLPIPEDMGKLSLFANYAYTSSQDQNAPYVTGTFPFSVKGAYGLLNLSADWRSIGGSNFDASLFATNVTNELYNVGITAQLGNYTTFYGEPRMYGIRLRYNFGER